jgi:hypothetical protein
VNVRRGSMQRAEHKNKIEGIGHRTGMQMRRDRAEAKDKKPK